MHPNIEGVRNDPRQKYLVSVNQLEAETGFKFFTALAPDLAGFLKGKIDGQPTPAFASFKITPGPISLQQINWLPIVMGGVILLLIVCISIGLLVFLMRRKR